MTIAAGFCWTFWYHLKYDLYSPILRPQLARKFAESNDELLGSIGWIDRPLTGGLQGRAVKG